MERERDPSDQPEDLRPAGPISPEGVNEADPDEPEPEPPSDAELAEEGSLLADRAQHGREGGGD